MSKVYKKLISFEELKQICAYPLYSPVSSIFICRRRTRKHECIKISCPIWKRLEKAECVK